MAGVGQFRKAGAAEMQGSLRRDPYLTNLSIRYQQDDTNFVSGVAATQIPVNHRSGYYLSYPKGQFWRDQMATRPLGGRPVQITGRVKERQFLAEEFALEYVLDDRLRNDSAAPVNLEEHATSMLTQANMIHSDVMWGSRFFKTDVWTHDFVGGTNFDPFDDSNSDPMLFIEQISKIMARGTGRRPNAIAVGANVDTFLTNHQGIRDIIKYTQKAVVTEDLLASLFKVDSYRCLMAIKENAPETVDEDDEDSDIDWICDPDAMWIGYISPTPALNTVTAIGRYSWSGYLPGAASGIGGTISRGREDRAYSDYFHVRDAYDQRVVCPDMGMFLSNVVSPDSALG